jgi:hypothetical protein
MPVSYKSLAVAMRPKYASMSLGTAITDEDEKVLNLDYVFDNFKRFKEFTVSGEVSSVSSPSSVEVVQDEFVDANDGLPF